MKKLLSKIGAGLLIALVTCWSFLSYPATVLATTFPDSDSFNGYTNGAGLAGLGTGWGEAWQAVGGETDLKVTNSGCVNTNCVTAQNTNADHGDDRNTSADVSNAYVSFYGQNTVNIGSANLAAYFQDTSSVERFNIRFMRSGISQQVKLNGATSVVLGNWDSGRNTFVEIEIGTDNSVSTSTACAANQVKAQIFGGTGWSSCVGFTNTGAVQNVHLGYQGGDGSVAGQYDDFNCPCGAAAAATTPRHTRIWLWNNPF